MTQRAAVAKDLGQKSFVRYQTGNGSVIASAMAAGQLFLLRCLGGNTGAANARTQGEAEEAAGKEGHKRQCREEERHLEDGT